MKTFWVGIVAALLTVAHAAGADAASAPPQVTVVTGSTKKVCQLTGEVDRQTQQVTLNQTESKAGFLGTDLGIPVEHDGRLFFLFGDTAPIASLVAGRGINGDALAVTDDTQPDDCVSLDFLRASDGWFARATIPGVSLEAFEVPTGGFSANGKLYAFYTTDHTSQKVMGRSVLASSTDGAQFAFVYSASTDRFINIAPVVVSNAAIPGVPTTAGQVVLLFASGAYRASSPSLAFVPLAAVEDRSAWRFFAGMQSGSDSPSWSTSESDAQTLFDNPCVGELSVAWNDYLRQWVMLYNCLDPRGIVLRTAEQPWGPWSDAIVLFDPVRDGGYCQFMHFVTQPPCDTLADMPWGASRETVFGGEYGPYVIPRFTTGQGQETTVYFTMSTWNPYQAVLMRSTLRAPAFSCAATAVAGCRTPTKAGASVLQLKANANPTKKTLAWKWSKGAATTLADFGDPRTWTTYALCVYDSTGGLVLSATAPAGGTCAGKPCWVAKKMGFKFVSKDLMPDGLLQLQLTAGSAGKAKIVAKGKGATLQLPTLPLTQNPTIVVQLQNSGGGCWGADYSAPAKQNASGSFNDKSD